MPSDEVSSLTHLIVFNNVRIHLKCKKKNTKITLYYLRIDGGIDPGQPSTKVIQLLCKNLLTLQ